MQGQPGLCSEILSQNKLIFYSFKCIMIQNRASCVQPAIWVLGTLANRALVLPKGKLYKADKFSAGGGEAGKS